MKKTRAVLLLAFGGLLGVAAAAIPDLLAPPARAQSPTPTQRASAEEMWTQRAGAPFDQDRKSVV